MSDLLAAALDYAARGLPVFPCVPRGKTPAVARGFHSATTNPATIRRYWTDPDRNVAIPTGASSGFWVLDIDGDEGEASLRALEAQHGAIPKTRSVVTSRGRHAWFAYPRTDPVDGRQDRSRPRYPRRWRLRHRAAVHPSNRPPLRLARRSMGTDRTRTGMADRSRPAPGRNAASPSAPWRRSGGRAVPVPTATPLCEPRSLALAATPPGCRNHALNRAAFSLFQLVAGGELAEAEVIAALQASLRRERPRRGRRLAERARHHPQRPRRRIAASEIAGRAMTEVLRPYQAEVIAKFWRAVEAGQRRILLVAPTASGKTVIARAIVEQARSKGCGSLFLAHRREIITQTSNKLRGIPHGIIRPGDQPRPLELVQVASVQTLHRRAIKAGTMELPEAGLVIVDECHHVVAQSYRSIIERYPDVDPARPHRHAMPWRRPRPRQHLPDHDPMPAGRRTRRAGLPGADPRLCAGRS